jgi:hypothetical protein
MTSDRLLREVRRQVGLGRLLPLGAREDGAWLTERAAGWALRRAVAEAVADVRLDRLRVGPDGDAEAPDAPGTALAVTPPPPGALPPGPLRIEAVCAAGLERPLPECVRHVRAVLATAARERVGLDVAAIDVHVAGLLEQPPPGGGRAAVGPEADPLSLVRPEADGAVADAVAEAVLAVPGVLGLSGALGGPSHALRVLDTTGGGPPGRLVRLQLAVTAGRRTAAVARRARAAAATAARAGAPGPLAVTILVSEVSDADPPPG